LQTHEHHDHLDPSHFASRSPLCGVHDAPRLHYYATQQALARAAQMLRAESGFSLLDPAVGDRLNLTVHAVEPFQDFEVGPYRIYSLCAHHAPETTALLYLVEKDGRTIFYATDTGELPTATWDALETHAPTIDLLIMDHTFGYQGRSNGHMNREQFLEQVAKLRQLGLMAADARIYATHIGHHSNEAHPQLTEIAEAHGYAIAYDGLTVQV
jgi:phosphoribosyl 1,2-cyclic phosphate phosphodiesterase